MPIQGVIHRALRFVGPDDVDKTGAHPMAPPEARQDEDMSDAGREVAEADPYHMIIYFAVFVGMVVTVCCCCGIHAYRERRKRDETVQRLASKRVVAGVSAIEKPPEGHEEEEEDGLQEILTNQFNVFLIFLPLGWASHLFHWGPIPTFLLNLLAMLPLANLMGMATEELACHTGQTIGGLLNATFGNMVELIVVVQSLREGLIAVTKGTLLGSVLANMLLVLGMSFFFGGLWGNSGGVTDFSQIAKNRIQTFNGPQAMIQAQLLLFSSFIISTPAFFQRAYKIQPAHTLQFSRVGSIFALFGYIIFMIFQLYTHKPLSVDEEEAPTISAKTATGLLVIATVLVAVTSEFLVHATEGFTHAMGFSQTFVGVVLIPIIGNACEHSTAVIVALKDKLDLSIGIALGSTIQIALLVTPFAVLVGWGLDQPMDLNFHRVNSWALLLSSLLVVCVLVTGTSNWLNGFVLITSYCVLAILYFLSPDDALV